MVEKQNIAAALQTVLHYTTPFTPKTFWVGLNFSREAGCVLQYADFGVKYVLLLQSEPSNKNHQTWA